MALNEYITRERILLDGSTSGPWQYGAREGVSHVRYGDTCGYCHYGAPRWTGPMEFNGQRATAHVHSLPPGELTRGITAYRLNGSVDVVIETSEYGLMASGDAEFIAHVRTAHERAVDALSVLAEHRNDLPEHIINAVEAALEETP